MSARDKRFASALEPMLAQPAAVRVLATGGWGTDQQLLAMLQKGRPWEPDTVVLAFCPTNDLSNILSNTHPNPDPAGAPTRKPYFVLGDDGGVELHSADGDLIADVALLSQIAQPSLFQSSLVALARYHLRSPTARRAGAPRPPRPDPRYTRFQALPNLQARCRGLFEGVQPLGWSPQHEVTSVSAYIHEDFEPNSYQWRLLEAVLSALKAEVDAPPPASGELRRPDARLDRSTPPGAGPRAPRAG